MVAQRKGYPIVPIILGSAMLIVVIAAALTPNFGSVAAQPSCQYNNCATVSGSAFPWSSVFIGFAIIVGATVLALFLIGRGRQPPAATPPSALGGVQLNSGDPPSPPSDVPAGAAKDDGANPDYF